MNDKLLKTRLNSIAHYKYEIEKLNQAIEATRQTREEIIKSLIEFVPFNAEDIITNGKRIYKVSSVNSVNETYSGLVVRFEYYGVSSNGVYDDTRSRHNETIPLNDIPTWQIVRSDKAQTN